MRLTTAGVAAKFNRPIVGRVGEEILVSPLDSVDPVRITGYKALVTADRAASDFVEEFQLPIVHSVRHFDHFRPNDVIVLNPGNGFIRTIFRPDSPNNALFITERCNSNCLMCSQPPKDVDDTQHYLDVNLQLIPFLPRSLEYLGITGGEPTLLGAGLLEVLKALKTSLPETNIHMLTNGRTFAQRAYTAVFAEAVPPRFSVGIPLYSDYAPDHDYIVQAKHAFDQTVLGIYELARFGVPVEIRVVLHRLTIPRLEALAEYIYRTFPFVPHVALMGLEPTGYAPRNWQDLWIDPLEYQDALQGAVDILYARGMNVSIYNLQLCLLPKRLWRFARRSISDWKNIFLPECQVCSVLERCGGFFQSAAKLHSPNIRAIQ
jgi:His-Xaa-Ser system radical SAM maturase HxsC